MKRRPTALLPACLLLAALAGTPRAGAEDRPAAGSDWLLRWDVRLWGADLALGYRGLRLFEGVDTILWLSGGGGYQSSNYYPAADDAGGYGEVGYRMVAADWRLGASQGILYRPRGDGNLLEAVALYRGKYQWYLENENLSPALADHEGILQNSLLLALVLDSTRFDRARITKDGLYGALSVEWVPAFLYNSLIGDSDYVRLTAILHGFRTLVSTDAVSVYLADRLIVDRLLGEEAKIPISARTTIGGLTKVPIANNPLRALGGSVRGVPNDRFDGYAKMVNNLDLRLHFPALTLFRLLTPGLVAYLDAGIYDRAAGRLSLEPVYASAGAGVLLNGLTYDFILYGNYFLNERVFSLSLGLGAHF